MEQRFYIELQNIEWEGEGPASVKGVFPLQDVYSSSQNLSIDSSIKDWLEASYGVKPVSWDLWVFQDAFIEPEPPHETKPRFTGRTGYTYRDLLTALKELDEEWLDAHATVYISSQDEFRIVQYTTTETEGDVLDKGHPFIVIDDGDFNE